MAAPSRHSDFQRPWRNPEPWACQCYSSEAPRHLRESWDYPCLRNFQKSTGPCKSSRDSGEGREGAAGQSKAGQGQRGTWLCCWAGAEIRLVLCPSWDTETAQSAGQQRASEGRGTGGSCPIKLWAAARLSGKPPSSLGQQRLGPSLKSQESGSNPGLH